MSTALIELFGHVAMAALCAAIANARGRRPALWFVLGLLLPCVGLIVVAVLPDAGPMAIHRRRRDQQQRRTPDRGRRVGASRDEQVPDEVADFRRAPRTANASPIRDDLDLVAVADVIPLPPPPPPPPAPAGVSRTTPPPIDVSGISWYYSEGAVQHGPVELEELRGLWEYGHVSGETLIWTKGLRDWLPIAEHDALNRALAG